MSFKASNAITHSNKHILHNGVYLNNHNLCQTQNNSITDKYDFGFVGFITDKLDIIFLNELSKNYSVALWGKCFDKNVLKQLSPSIYIGGAFTYNDLPEIMLQFKVGLLPYKIAKSHDESPLKMYEYFKYNKPCLASMHFELKSRYYINYLETNDAELENSIRFLLSVSGTSKISDQIQDDWHLSFNVRRILEDINDYIS